MPLNIATLVVLTVVVAVVVWLVIYVVRVTTAFKTTAESLEDQLRQFKERGFDELVSKKLETLTQKATQELQNREHVIRQSREELLNQQREATEAAQAFKTDLGTVRTKIEGLSELQSQVGALNDLLKPQQLRGELGEVIVRTLVADKLPRAQYEEDYAFADGKKVEFVIRLNDRLIPIDSKLQLEDYKRMRDADERQRPAYRAEFKRTIKQKIDEVKAYIRPEEGTYNFALMVIPSEAVYYDLIANKDFVEPEGLYYYAKSRNVFMVSPLTFWAYVTAIAEGLRGMEIGRRAEEILSGLETLATKIRQFSQDEFRVLGSHLRNASNQYEDAARRLRDIESGLTVWEQVEANTISQQGAAP